MDFFPKLTSKIVNAYGTEEQKQNYSNYGTLTPSSSQLIGSTASANGSTGATDVNGQSNYQVKTDGLLTADDQQAFQMSMFDKYKDYTEQVYNRQLAEMEKYNRNYYTNYVQSLKNAGLNPILAVQNGLNASSLQSLPTYSSFAGASYAGANDDSLITGMLNMISSLFSSALSALVKI